MGAQDKLFEFMKPLLPVYRGILFLFPATFILLVVGLATPEWVEVQLDRGVLAPEIFNLGLVPRYVVVFNAHPTRGGGSVFIDGQHCSALDFSESPGSVEATASLSFGNVPDSTSKPLKDGAFSCAMLYDYALPRQQWKLIPRQCQKVFYSLGPDERPYEKGDAALERGMTFIGLQSSAPRNLVSNMCLVVMATLRLASTFHS